MVVFEAPAPRADYYLPMTPEDVLGYWFGRAVEEPAALPERMRFWFGSGSDVPEEVAARDEDMRRRFAGLMDLQERGELAGWQAHPRGRLALILLTDQLPRNVHRGSSLAFASDRHARALCIAGLELGHDRALAPLERAFFYLPLEHSELLADQDRCVSLFEALERDAPPGLGETFAGFTDYAARHRDIVARFGRFPHRNRALDRANTPEEDAYLAGDAPAFGQR